MTSLSQAEAHIADQIAEHCGPETRRAWAMLSLELAELRRFEQRMALCPDHRDKQTGEWCAICREEHRVRQEIRDDARRRREDQHG